VFGASVTGTGVDAESTGGYGLYASSTGSDGVHGATAADGMSGVAGFNTSTTGSLPSFGGFFASGASNHNGIGAFGAGGVGILGVSNNAPQVGLANIGVEGATNSGTSVYGYNSGSGDGVEGQTADAYSSGVFGDNTAAGKGVFGASVNGTGVDAESTGGYGIYASSTANDAIYASSNGNDGIHAVSNAAGYAGVYGTNTTSSGYAGYFQGNVNITGNLTVNGSQSGAWSASNNNAVGIISDGAQHELTQLNLPAGNYALTAKTVAAASVNTHGDVYCYLDGPSGNIDESHWYTQEGNEQGTISLEGTVSLSALGSITLSCTTIDPGEEALDSKIIAVGVGSLH
jgi:hypothetical protein